MSDWQRDSGVFAKLLQQPAGWLLVNQQAILRAAERKVREFIAFKRESWTLSNKTPRRPEWRFGQAIKRPQRSRVMLRSLWKLHPRSSLFSSTQDLCRKERTSRLGKPWGKLSGDGLQSRWRLLRRVRIERVPPASQDGKPRSTGEME